MIQASPGLRSLDLTISTHCWNAAPWPEGPSSPCSVKVFRDLRTYRIGGTLDPNWRSFFETPETNKFRSFLQLHPHLDTVTIMPNPSVEQYHSVDPETLAGLFPSLRHFEGSAFLCEALVQSTLASRLETLGMSGSEPRLLRIAKTANHLPELRTLKLMLRQPITRTIISTLLAIAPKLTHLYISHISANQVCRLTFQSAGPKH